MSALSHTMVPTTTTTLMLLVPSSAPLRRYNGYNAHVYGLLVPDPDAHVVRMCLWCDLDEYL